MQNKKEIVFLVFLVFIFIFINYNFLDSKVTEFLNEFSEEEFVMIERVIDGDTIVWNGTSIRLLGIDAPERGERYFKESKEFLEDLVLDKEVLLEFSGRKYDRYRRILAYVHIDRKNVNLELVRNGFANYYSYDGKSRYREDFILAWEECLRNNENICERSLGYCASCIKLREFNYGNEDVIFYNRCSFNCDLTGWELRDEGRKSYFFEDFTLGALEEIKVVVGEGRDSERVLYWGGESSVWTTTGDTLFLRDREGKLVLWEFLFY